MASELQVQIPADYGNLSSATLGSPLLALMKYGRDTGMLLNLHLQIVLYSKRERTDGILPQASVLHLTYPSPMRTAKRDLNRLAEAGLIEARDDDTYYIPAALEWPSVRTGARGPIPAWLRTAVHERDGWRCVECGSDNDLTLDHVFPWSLDGPDDEENLRTLCGSCNSRKGARA